MCTKVFLRNVGVCSVRMDTEAREWTRWCRRSFIYQQIYLFLNVIHSLSNTPDLYSRVQSSAGAVQLVQRGVQRPLPWQLAQQQSVEDAVTHTQRAFQAVRRLLQCLYIAAFIFWWIHLCLHVFHFYLLWFPHTLLRLTSSLFFSDGGTPHWWWHRRRPHQLRPASWDGTVAS